MEPVHRSLRSPNDEALNLPRIQTDAEMVVEDQGLPSGWWFAARTTAYFLAAAGFLLGVLAYLGLAQIRSANADHSSIRIDRAGRSAAALSQERMTDITVITKNGDGSPQRILYRSDGAVSPGDGWDTLVDLISEVNQGAANVFAFNQEGNSFDRVSTTFKTPTGERAGGSQVEPGLINVGHPAFESLTQLRPYVGEVPVAGRLRLAYLTPIVDEDETLLGILAVDVGWVDDLNRINEESADRALAIALSFLLILALVSVVVMFFSFRPLRRLTRIAHELGAEEGPKSIELTGRRDEIGYLAQGLAKVAELRQRLEHRAYYDVLTEMPNRAALLEEVERRFTSVDFGPLAERGQGFALLIIDLDGFKEVNDSLGHQAGDELLQHIAQLLEESKRPGEFIARLGGDEFALLTARGTSSGTQAHEAADRMRGAVNGVHGTSLGETRVSTSIGMALAPDQCANAAEALSFADLALYSAKRDGRGMAVLYQAELSTSFDRRMYLTGELRRALDSGGLRVAYQPIFDAATGAIHSVEALTRWEHPVEGPISPGEFIPVAESAGLIGELGAFVFEEVCRQIAVWRDGFESPPIVAVNLSTLQLHQASLVSDIRSVMEERNTPPALLRFELTESVLLAGDSAKQLQVVSELLDLGISLSVDDFGTGYSSLGYLHALDVDELKIDRVFVSGAVEDGEQAKLLAGIVALGSTLGLQVVVEGIETAEELALAQRLGANLVQGFYLARPGWPDLIQSYFVGSHAAWDVPQPSFEAMATELQEMGGLRSR